MAVRISRYIVILLTFGLTMAMTSCHTSRSISKDKHPSEIGSIDIGKPKGVQKLIVEEALTWVGTPYKYACDVKGEGADCSGMVMRVYETVSGLKLPRNSAKQAEFCKHIDTKDVRMGDLIFFATGKDPERVSHVGIVVDNAHFVHSSGSRGVVVSEIYSPYYQRTFRMFGRVPEINQELAGNDNDKE